MALRVALCSHVFPPSVGGIEAVSAMVARGLHDLGLDVRVLTNTAERGDVSYPFEVIRSPSYWQARSCLSWADVVLHSHLSLKLAPPLLLVRRPWVVVHHTWFYPGGAGAAWLNRFKRWILSMARCYAVSRALAKDFSNPTGVLPNPYDEATFGSLPASEGTRPKDIIFVGRLVSDKGVNVLINALATMRDRGQLARLTIVGDGPNLPLLKAQVAQFGIDQLVVFAGRLSGPALAECMREHKVMAVPSVWREPFGLVALEGIASGCAIVASQIGGLPDAVGPCGVLVPPGDVTAWANALSRMLNDDDCRRECLEPSATHLAQHQIRHVCQRYVEVLQAAVNRKAVL